MKMLPSRKSLRLVLSVAALVVLPEMAAAAGGGAALEHFTPERTDRTLQRGAKIFMNYCMGCHNADYHRYSHMARDIGLSDQAVSDNLIFTTDTTRTPENQRRQITLESVSLKWSIFRGFEHFPLLCRGFLSLFPCKFIDFGDIFSRFSKRSKSGSFQ